MTKYYVDAEGVYIGGFDGAEPPSGAIEVPYPPQHAEDVWTGGGYDASLRIVNDQLAAIDAKYADDFRRLNSAMTAALLSGGPSMETKLDAIRAEWQNVSNLKSAEIAAILEAL